MIPSLKKLKRMTIAIWASTAVPKISTRCALTCRTDRCCHRWFDTNRSWSPLLKKRKVHWYSKLLISCTRKHYWIVPKLLQIKVMHPRPITHNHMLIFYQPSLFPIPCFNPKSQIQILACCEQKHKILSS